MKQRILTLLFLACAICPAAAPTLFAQITPPDPVYAKKSAEIVDADHVKLTLESFVSGNNVASDIAILMDMSASMQNTIAGSGQNYALERKLTEETKINTAANGRTATTNAMSPTAKGTRKNNVSANNRNWTFNNLSGQNFPFYLYNGNYYKVQRGNDLGESHNIRALWIDTPDGRKYLNGTMLSNDPGTVTTDTGTIYSGTLYNGYTWANIVAGTTAGETTVSCLYNGDYYPVKRNRFNADGTRNDSNGPVYALWIDTPDGVKFLFGDGFRALPEPTITANSYYIYYGDLYDSGWTYDGINGPWYYDYNGTYYPVHKSEAGTPPYRLWINVGDETMYLNGNGLSDHYVNSVNTTTQSIYFGNLYNGGWYYNSFNTGATSDGETVYTYLYAGDYHPVKRGRFNADGTPNSSNGAYAIYIELAGTRKFLSGNGLLDTPYELVTTPGTVQTRSLFSGTLYSGGWSYTNVTGDNVYYYLLDGIYYPVKRSNTLPDGQGNNNVRALWIELPGGQIKYLKGEGLADDYLKSFHSDAQGVFYGVLYSGGWSYSTLAYGNTDGNAEYQWYYRDAEGKYYPVRRANNLGGGNVKAMWICMDPSNTSARKYLSGQGLADDFDHSITSDSQIIYLGTLYKGWTRANADDGYYYKHDDNNYYLVKTENLSPGGHQLYVEIGNPLTRYYLNGNTISTTPNPYATNNNNISLYFGDLYFSRSNLRKGDYLKKAVEALLDALAEDAGLDNLHHRVSLAQFNSSGWSDGQNHTADTYLPYPYLATSPIGGENAHLVSDFKDITDSDNLASLKNAMALPHTISGVSHYEWGLSLAKGLFERELGPTAGKDINNDGIIEGFELPSLSGADHENYPGRPKIVIIIGDCDHNGNATYDDTYATALKNEINALIFVVYVNTSTGQPLRNAEAWASRNDLISKVKEFDETLVSTLRGLAREIREALIVLGAGTVVQDVIADGFEIPDETNGVKVFTADHVSGLEKETMVFADPVEASDPVSLSFGNDDAGRRIVKVSGFDFSENFCGTLRGQPHGKKLILKIDVARTTAVGGLSTVTNVMEQSGMKYSADGEFVFNFENPVAALPVNIVIQKEGLVKGESAVFTVSPIDGDGNPISTVRVNDADVPVKPHRVILTGTAADGSAAVSATLKHLNGNCNWLVTEEGWSWDYVVNDGNASLSTATQLLNPFVFTNVKQNTTVKAAESKVTNDFGANTATTVNSKEP